MGWGLAPRFRIILQSFLHAHLGGQTRLRAVLQRGLADFATSGEDDALQQFIHYILKIETVVETAQEETQGLAHGSRTRRLPDAPERSTAEANTSRHPPWRIIQEETRGLARGPGKRRLPDALERTTAEANTSRHRPWRRRAT